jgi:hypothetical protein
MGECLYVSEYLYLYYISKKRVSRKFSQEDVCTCTYVFF